MNRTRSESQSASTFFVALTGAALIYSGLVVASTNVTDRSENSATARRGNTPIESQDQQPSIVLYVVSLSCSHCYEQIEVFQDEFPDRRIVVVSPQMDSEIRNRLSTNATVRFVHDPDEKWLAKLHLPNFSGMHATVILDRHGNKYWQHTDEEPLLDTHLVEQKIAECESATGRPDHNRVGHAVPGNHDG